MMNDEWLRSAYRRLLDERAATAPPDIDLHVLQAAADGSLEGEERAAVIDRAIAHPETAREYAFLAEIARARRSPASPRTWFAVAAALTAVFATAVLVSRGERQSLLETLRGEADAPVLLQPQAGARVATGTRFIWSAFPAATSYHLEIIESNGTVVAEAVTNDTVWTLTEAAGLQPDTELLWWVTAQLVGGEDRRAQSRPITTR